LMTGELQGEVQLRIVLAEKWALLFHTESGVRGSGGWLEATSESSL
jgi:hypothetical protein